MSISFPAGPRVVTDAPRRSRRPSGGFVRRSGARLLSLAVLLLAWWIVTELQVWSELFVPRPAAVFDRFVDGVTIHDGQRGLSGHYLWEHLGASLRRIGIGVGLAVLFGVPLGLLLASVRAVQVVVEPYVNFIRALPPLAYFSLLIIWFGIEDASKVWLLFLASFAPIALSVVSGVQTIRRDRIDAAQALGASRLQIVRHVTLPSVLPELFTGIRLSLGFAWTTIVAAETVDGIPGIGGLAWSTKKFQQTDVAVLCIVVIGITALLLDGAIKAAERRAVPWKGKA
jgi:taurine transport system permease protein